MTDRTLIAPVTVPADPVTAFDVFTTGIASWWPVAGHSVGEERVTGVEIAPRTGGLVEEVWDDGTRVPWADVLAWDPPRLLRLAWNAGGYGVREPSTVEVTFTESAEGETLVRLVHSDWEVWGAEVREDYAEGWVFVLGQYVGRLTS